MLEKIIESKAESNVLGFLLAAPPRAFSAFEVARRLSMPQEKVTRTLKKLSQGSYVASFAKKGKKYYMLNGKSKLLPEVRTYFQKNGPKYQDELFTAVRKLGDIRAAFLSGVFTGYPSLPVDLLLVGKVNLRKLSDFLKHLEKMMGQEINYSIMTVDEFQLRRNTFDKFIKDIFDYRHIVVLDTVTPPKKK